MYVCMYSFLIFGIYFVAMKELNAYRKKNGCMKSNSNHEKLERKCFKHKQLWSCTTVPLIPNMTLLWLPSFLESCPSFPFSYWVIFTQITAFFFPIKIEFKRLSYNISSPKCAHLSHYLPTSSFNYVFYISAY